MRPNHAVRSRGAFTLVEMIVTICIIGLLAAISMPAMIQLFKSGADTQVYNVVSVELVNARSFAMQNNCYAGVHFQERVAGTGVFYCGVVAGTDETTDFGIVDAKWNITKSGDITFGLAPGYMLQELPGGIAIGQVDGYVDDSSNYKSGSFTDATASPDAPYSKLQQFTTATVVFDPRGAISQQAKAKPIRFATNAKDVFLFRFDYSNQAKAPDDVKSDVSSCWPISLANADKDGKVTTGSGKDGATAVTMFEYRTLAAYPEADRAGYLTQYAQILPVNLYTGQLYDRK